MSALAAALAAAAVAIVLWPACLPRARRHQGRPRWLGEPPWRRARVRREGRQSLPAVCRALSAELRAGASPGHALAAVAPLAPESLGLILVRAGRAAVVGGASGAALRAGAERCPGLELLAACWEVSADVGSGLAEACDHLAGALDAELRAQREVAAALAGPRASALVLSLLPAAGLVLAAALGARPVQFATTLPGVVCLTAGATLDVAGVLWTRRLATRAVR